LLLRGKGRSVLLIDPSSAQRAVLKIKQRIAKRTPALPVQGLSMSEGYTIDGANDEVAGIVVRYAGERGFRFHSAAKS
jgi:hypothetical protein